MRLLLHARNDTDRTITASVDGVRYEYWFRGDHRFFYNVAEFMLRKGIDAVALNYLKHRSYRTERLEP